MSRSGWVGFWACLLALAVTGCTSDGDERKRKELRCTKMRDHVVELRLVRAGASLSSDELAQHRANLRAAAGDDYVERCLAERSEEYIDCALKARSTDELGRCGR